MQFLCFLEKAYGVKKDYFWKENCYKNKNETNISAKKTWKYFENITLTE